MFEDSGFCDEVIIAAPGDAYRDVFGKEAFVLKGMREADGIWYSALVPGGKVWKIRASDTVPTGRRVPESIAI